MHASNITMNFLLNLAVLLSIVPFEGGKNLSKDLVTESFETLHIFAAKYEPYLYGNNQGHIYIEHMLIKTIAEKLNLSIVFRSTSRKNISFHWNPSSE